MAAQLNDTVGIYPQQYEEKKMEERIQAILKERFGRDLDNCTKSEIFEALMVITKQEMAGRAGRRQPLDDPPRRSGA